MVSAGSLLCALLAVLLLAISTVGECIGAETRVRGIDLALSTVIRGVGAASPGTHPGIGYGYDETASDRANQYNGRVYDPGTGFHDYGARMYWPQIGRFISADSYQGDIANPASLNRYSYVLNNPYKYVDPTGNAPQWANDLRDFLRNQYERAGRAITNGLNPRQSPRNEVEAEMASDSARTAHEMGTGLGDAAYDVTEDAVVSMALAAGTKVAGGAAEEVLSRFGTSRESASRLARKAAEAEERIGVHGVSTTARKVEGASSAARSEVEKAFKVHNTGSDPLHRTVELPKPVTQDVADKFNTTFGR